MNVMTYINVALLIAIGSNDDHKGLQTTDIKSTKFSKSEPDSQFVRSINADTIQKSFAAGK